MSALLSSPLLPVSRYTDRRYLRRGEGKVTLAAAMSPDWTPVASIVVPQQEAGYIVAWFAEVNDPSWDPANSSIAFRVSRGSSPYIDYGSVQQPMGDRIRPEDTMLRVEPNDNLIVSARRTVTNLQAQQVVAGLRCILWPLEPCGDLRTLVGQ